MVADFTALWLSFAYVAGIVGLGEVARRLAGLPDHTARKLIHVGAGLWIFPTLLWFGSRWWAMVPPLAAVAVNYAIGRWQLVAAMGGEKDSWGTVWFPLGLAVLIALFWDQPAMILAGVLPLTFGDPAAAVVGRRLGWGRYGSKSLAGTAAMFVVSLAAVWGGWAWFPGMAASWPATVALWPAVMVVAAAAAVLEALPALWETPGRLRGLDDLLVPLGTAAVCRALVALAAGSPPGGDPIGRLALGAGLSLLIGLLAYGRGALAETGVLGAVITGTLIFGLGGWAPGVALVFFFASSSLLSRLTGGRKAAAEKHYEKGARRDLGQALANGGLAAALCVAAAATGDSRWLAAAVGAVAAACADTWATELGALAAGVPRLITSLRPVPTGTSGAISLPGTLAAGAGAAATGLAAALGGIAAWWPPAGGGAAGTAVGTGAIAAVVAGVAAVALAGLAGSLFDSWLGATLQAQYRCRVCGEQTERTDHCGTQTRLVRGWAWLANDGVNVLATAAGALIMYWLA